MTVLYCNLIVTYLKVHHRVQKSLPLDYVGQIIPVHTLTELSFETPDILIFIVVFIQAL
jgi:hypothetical protein